MHDSDIVRDLKQKRLHIDFISMSLEQNKDSDDKVVYKGPGYIEQSDSDTISFKLYAIEAHTNIEFFDRLNANWRIKKGEIYPEQSYYTLTGTSLDGSKWKSERIIPYINLNISQKNSVVHGEISSITCVDMHDSSTRTKIHFFEKIRLPMSGQEMQVSTSGYDFHIEQLVDGFTVNVSSNSPLPDDLTMRVEEALCFMLAQPVLPRVIAQATGTRLKSTTLRSKEVRLQPPISGKCSEDHSWKMFEKYFSYVTENATTGLWHL